MIVNAKIEIIVVSLTLQRPKSKYQFLFYRDNTNLTWKKQQQMLSKLMLEIVEHCFHGPSDMSFSFSLVTTQVAIVISLHSLSHDIFVIWYITIYQPIITKKKTKKQKHKALKCFVGMVFENKKIVTMTMEQLAKNKQIM